MNRITAGQAPSLAGYRSSRESRRLGHSCAWKVSAQEKRIAQGLISAQKLPSITETAEMPTHATVHTANGVRVLGRLPVVA